ncbi:MAG: hypothetical protein COA91_08980 [Robiginitomaculum sp.]|nr:MAG: hypothetical protein COA91_08980 [Robiginitomaculum sp.]
MTSVEEKLATYPELLAKRLSQVRTLVQEIATTTKSIGTLEENLKWGQISIATVRPKTGTPIRIDGNMDAATYSIYMPCSSNLMEGFRTLHPDMFDFHGNREIRLELSEPMPEAELTLFITAALRYYLK